MAASKDAYFPMLCLYTLFSKLCTLNSNLYTLFC